MDDVVDILLEYFFLTTFCAGQILEGIFRSPRLVVLDNEWCFALTQTKIRLFPSELPSSYCLE